eukprot:g1721.t1
MATADGDDDFEVILAPAQAVGPMYSSPRHLSKVAAIVDQVKARPDGKLLRILKKPAVANTHDQNYKDPATTHPVDVTTLGEILEVDAGAGLVSVEGHVTMEALCSHLLQEHGMLIPVVPEMSKFTVAGLANGGGIQSSCHKHGLMWSTFESFEVVLADGRHVLADRKRNADVFGMVAHSYGTVAIVVAATLRLVPALSHVRCTYRHFDDRRAFSEAVTRCSGPRSPYEFVEGIVMSRQDYLLVTGTYYDPKDASAAGACNAGACDAGAAAGSGAEGDGSPHCLEMGLQCRGEGGGHGEGGGRGMGVVDCIPTLEYLFRLERGAWWIIEMIVHWDLLTHTRWGRNLLDSKVEQLDRGEIPRKEPCLTLMEQERCRVLQDVGVKLSRLEEGIEYVEDDLAVYPLWICPFFLPDRGDLVLFPREVIAGELMSVDLGIYGAPTVRDFDNVEQMPRLQRFVDGPSSWGVVYLPPEEIKALKNWDQYERVRRDTGAQGVLADYLTKVTYHGDAEAASGGGSGKKKKKKKKKRDTGPIPYWRMLVQGIPNPRWHLAKFLGGVLVVLVLVMWAAWRLGCLACGLVGGPTVFWPLLLGGLGTAYVACAARPKQRAPRVAVIDPESSC